jgi:hypothetical protein
MDGMNDKLDALWVEYRAAVPDPEPGPGFGPRLWQRIEERRARTAYIFRRLVQGCVMATVALALVLGVVVIPRAQSTPVYPVNYVDVLAADLPNNYVDILNGDIK